MPYMTDDYPHVEGIVRPQILQQGFKTFKQKIVFVDSKPRNRSDDAYLHVDPGICGFQCTVCALRLRGRMVELRIEGSECRHIQHLSELVSQMEFRDILKPATVNPIFVSADKSRCCPSCPVPTALIKVAEVALGFALQRDIIMHFRP